MGDLCSLLRRRRSRWLARTTAFGAGLVNIAIKWEHRTGNAADGFADGTATHQALDVMNSMPSSPRCCR